MMSSGVKSLDWWKCAPPEIVMNKNDRTVALAAWETGCINLVRLP
jgi:hypothetical protein